MNLRPLVIALLLPAPLAAQETVEFSGHSWATAGTVQVEQYLGRPAMHMRGGRAELEGVEFANGTIEFDIAVSGYRSFVGTSFRRNQQGTQAEFFYLRPHQTGRFDALQYTPVENGISAWQLFPEYNAEVMIPADEWLPVRLVVRGAELEVYVGGASQPAMRARLATDRTSGSIALVSGVPGGTGGLAAPPGLLTTAYSNFRVTPAPAPVPADPPAGPDAAFIADWVVSPAVAAPDQPPTALTDGMMADGWMPVEADHTGRINLARYRAIPEGANRGMVLVKTTVASDRDQVRYLGIGFSDIGSVFVNGQLIYQANNTYLSRSGRYLGVMTVDNDVIAVPLRPGNNEIVVAVIESFGGWGLVAKWR